MKKIISNIWHEKTQVKVVPTNGIYTSRDIFVHRAVMGAGLAKQAAGLWPILPISLGNRLHRYGNRLYVFQVPPAERDILGCTTLVTFPTKHDWRDNACPQLVERSTQELVQASIQNGWEIIYLPPVGCGLGGLSWQTVELILDHHLDHRFTVVDLE